MGPGGPRPYNERYPPEPYQPPPPGIKDSPTNGYSIQIMYYDFSRGFNIDSETTVGSCYFYIVFYSPPPLGHMIIHLIILVIGVDISVYLKVTFKIDLALILAFNFDLLVN